MIEGTLTAAKSQLETLAGGYRSLEAIRWRDHAWYVVAEDREILFWYDDLVGAAPRTQPSPAALLAAASTHGRG